MAGQPEVFEISLEVNPKAAANLDAYASKTGTNPNDVLLEVLTAVFTRNLFASILEPATPAPLGDRRYKGNDRARWAPPICDICGGPRSTISSTGLCRPCYYATLRKPAKIVQLPVCVDCKGPRSVGSAQRCSACYQAHAAATRAARAAAAASGRCRTCGTAIGPLSKWCRPCYQAQAQAKRRSTRLPEPFDVKGVVGLPPRELISAPLSPDPAPEPLVPAEPVIARPAPAVPTTRPISAPPEPKPVELATGGIATSPAPEIINRDYVVPRHVADRNRELLRQVDSRADPEPLLEPARNIDDADPDELATIFRREKANYESMIFGEDRPTPQSQRVECKARGFKPAPDPLAKRDRPTRKAAPAFSPEFLAQLEKVKNGAPIVTVAPIRKAEDVGGSTGSSLDFV